MKKSIAILLAVMLCLGLWGCEQASSMENPVNFYYLTADLSYKIDSTAIRSETREGAEMGSLEHILSIYLAGPESETLRSPFPEKLDLVQVQQDGTTVFITVSAELARLSGLELVMACGCISMTCLELTDAEKVSISAADALLNGQGSIIMDKNSLLLLDESVPPEGE